MTKRPTTAIALGLLATLPLLAAGCGAESSGAKLKPEVTVLDAAHPGTPEATEDVEDTGAEQPAGDLQYGTIRGRFVYSGNYSPLPFNGSVGARDRDVCKPELIGNDRFRVNTDAGNTIRDVFVWLRKPPSSRPAPTEASEATEAPEGAEGEPAGMEWFFNNENCRFEPHGMVIPVGQTVTVTNKDGTPHNTKVTSPGIGNDSFNATLNQGDTATLTYNRPVQLPVSVVCDFHAWMKGWHLVVRDPRDADVTGETGEFVLPDLPYGTHKIRVWHEAMGGVEEYEVNVDAEDVVFEQTFGPGDFQGIADRRDDFPTIVLGGSH